MSALVKHLSQYAAYHRDGRNVATHIIGIPLIVLAVEVLLSRPQWNAGPLTLSPAIIASTGAAIYYISLDITLGAAMAGLLGLGAWIGFALAGMPTEIWAAAGAGGFVLGWVIQFIGHRFEGRKPAFLDDLMSLMIGPLFVMVEVIVSMGFRAELKKQINTAADASVM